MHKKLIAAIAFMTITVSSAFSLNTPFPGYYVNLHGDSVTCSIDYADWNRNPKTVQITVNGVSREYNPEEIRGFGVYGYADYVSATLSYHLSPMVNGIYPLEFSNSIQVVSCFLKTLVQGHYSLYSLLDTEKGYFFYRETDGKFIELMNRIRTVDERPEEEIAYRQQIYNLFEIREMVTKNKNRIQRAKYDTSDLIPLFKSLNIGYNLTK